MPNELEDIEVVNKSLSKEELPDLEQENLSIKKKNSLSSGTPSSNGSVQSGGAGQSTEKSNPAPASSTAVAIPTPRPEISHASSVIDRMNDETKKRFLTNNLFNKPEARETYYNTLKELKYSDADVQAIRKKGEEVAKIKPQYDKLDKAIKANPTDRASQYQMGDVLMKLGDNEQALSAYSEALKNNRAPSPSYSQEADVKQVADTDSNILYGRANALSAMGDNKSAAEDYSKAIKADPKNPLPYKGLAYLAHKKGDIEGTRQALQMAKKAELEQPPLQPPRIGEDPEEIRQTQQAKDLSGAMEGIVFGEGPLSFATNPVGSVLNAAVSGVKGGWDELKNVPQIYKDEGGVAATAVTAAASAKIGFGVLTAVNPELALFHLGTEAAGTVLPEKVIDAVTSPVTEAMKYFDIKQSQKNKAIASIGDIVAQVLLAEGGAKIGKKFMENKPLSAAEVQKTGEIMANASPVVMKEASTKVITDQPPGDNIPTIKNDVSDKAKIESDLQNPKISEESKDVLRKKLSGLNDNITDGINKGTLDHSQVAEIDSHIADIDNKVESVKKDMDQAESKDIFKEQIAELKTQKSELKKAKDAITTKPSKAEAEALRLLNDKRNAYIQSKLEDIEKTAAGGVKPELVEKYKQLWGEQFDKAQKLLDEQKPVEKGIIENAEKEADNLTPKTETDAVQIGSPAEVLQLPQGGVGETGSGRPRMERSKQGKEAPGTSKEEEIQKPPGEGGDGGKSTEEKLVNLYEKYPNSFKGLAHRMSKAEIAKAVRDIKKGKSSLEADAFKDFAKRIDLAGGVELRGAKEGQFSRTTMGKQPLDEYIKDTEELENYKLTPTEEQVAETMPDDLSEVIEKFGFTNDNVEEAAKIWGFSPKEIEQLKKGIENDKETESVPGVKENTAQAAEQGKKGKTYNHNGRDYQVTTDKEGKVTDVLSEQGNPVEVPTFNAIKEKYESEQKANKKDDTEKGKEESIKPVQEQQGKIIENSLVKPVSNAISNTLKSALETFYPGEKLGRAFGEDVEASTISKLQTPDVVMNEFNESLTSAEKTVKELKEHLEKNFTTDELHDANLAYGTPETPEGQTIQQDAIKRLEATPKGKELLDFNKGIRKEISDKLYDIAKNHGFDDLEYFQDYFYGNFEGTEANKNALQKKLEEIRKEKQSTYKSTNRFTKEKFIATHADAEALGLRVKDINPITNLEKEAYAIGTRAGLKAIKDEIEKTEAPYAIKDDVYNPDVHKDWDVIDDPIFNGMLFHPDFARVVNNLREINGLSKTKGLRNMRRAVVAMQGIKFFGSAFHTVNIAKAAIASGGIEGIKNFASAFTKLLDKKDPAYSDYLQHGGGLHYSKEEATVRTFQENFDKAMRWSVFNNPVAKALGVPLKYAMGKYNPISPAFAKAMFNEWIPAIKFLRYKSELMKFEKENNRPATTAEKVRITKRTQEFFGEMNEKLYGRSGTVTASTRLIFMAPGYGEGNFLHQYRALQESGQLSAEAAKAIKSGEKGGLKKQWSEVGVKNLAFIANTFITTAALSTIGTYLLTGKAPKPPENENEVRDLFKIKTGQKDGNGDYVYIDMMTYEKDPWSVFGNLLAGHPEKMVSQIIDRIKGMVSSPFKVATDMATIFEGGIVVDYKGDPIYNPEDDLHVKWTKFLIHEGTVAEPISYASFTQAVKEGKGVAPAIATSVVGLRGTTSENIKEEKKIIQSDYNLQKLKDSSLKEINKTYKTNPEEAKKEADKFNKDQEDKLRELTIKDYQVKHNEAPSKEYVDKEISKLARGKYFIEGFTLHPPKEGTQYHPQYGKKVKGPPKKFTIKRTKK